jgi:hypothetical protein
VLRSKYKFNAFCLHLLKIWDYVIKIICNMPIHGFKIICTHTSSETAFFFPRYRIISVHRYQMTVIRLTYSTVYVSEQNKYTFKLSKMKRWNILLKARNRAASSLGGGQLHAVGRPEGARSHIELTAGRTATRQKMRSWTLLLPAAYPHLLNVLYMCTRRSKITLLTIIKLRLVLWTLRLAIKDKCDDRNWLLHVQL